MSALKEVASSELLDLYLAEQTGLLTEALLMANRIHKAYRELHHDRIEMYLACKDEFYDFYTEAEWVLADAEIAIEKQVREQAEIIDFTAEKYYQF